MRLGYAVAWAADRRQTWSRTPWNLRAELSRRTELIDVGVEPPRFRVVRKLLHARLRGGRLTTNWRQSASWYRYCGREIRRRVRAERPDSVLEMQDLAAVEVPFFIFQDLSYDLVDRYWEEASIGFPALSRDMVRRRAERQRRLYEGAAGVIGMSRWMARALTELSGVPEARAHVVHPGATALGPHAGAMTARGQPRRRLLFVGTQFALKGGDLVVAALARLRREVDPQITLTVAGPSTWPARGGPPDGVRFLGNLPPGRVAQLWDAHDLFVMPSQFEGFGIVFVEALAGGLPCIGRDACAMPEIISPGVNGGLVTSDDPDEMSDLIARTLTDDGLYAACAAAAPATEAHFTWGRAAVETLAAIGGKPVLASTAWTPQADPRILEGNGA